jgi:hypothetical protein
VGRAGHHANGRGERPLPWGSQAPGPERAGGWLRASRAAWRDSGAARPHGILGKRVTEKRVTVARKAVETTGGDCWRSSGSRDSGRRREASWSGGAAERDSTRRRERPMALAVGVAGPRAGEGGGRHRAHPLIPARTAAFGRAQGRCFEELASAAPGSVTRVSEYCRKESPRMVRRFGQRRNHELQLLHRAPRFRGDRTVHQPRRPGRHGRITVGIAAPSGLHCSRRVAGRHLRGRVRGSWPAWASSATSPCGRGRRWGCG